MTGSRNGVSNAALKSFQEFLIENKKQIIEGHHGDCVGADTIFHNELTKNNIQVVIHPPNVNSMRSFCKSENILRPKSYLERNKDIVNSSTILVAFPDSEHERVRSGTWSTVRYARKREKEIHIFLPDGDVIIEMYE